MPNQVPRHAEPSSHGVAATANIPSSIPLKFARQASIPRPRTRLAHAVVIPQVGQGRPTSMRNVQGGSPSCWCVPQWSGLGLSIAATASSPSSPTPTVASKSRRRQENAVRPIVSVPISSLFAKGIW